VKAYRSEAAKAWFPYEWFDRPEKLDYPGLAEFEAWYSKLKGGYVLTRAEWEECQRVFKEQGMRTFGDWLCYYNNLDVGPGLEALEKMKSFYTARGIDILKDAVSLPGVSLHYVLQGAIERGADLWSPDREAYSMLKRAVVGGPSLVFMRYPRAGAAMQKDRGLRRERTLPVDDVESNAVRKGVGEELHRRPPERSGRSPCASPEIGPMVRFRGSGHRDSAKPVGQV